MIRSRLVAITAVAVFLPAAASADKVDPRLATVRKVFITAANDAGDDQGVATCLADRLASPFEVVKTKEEADAVLVVKAHVPSSTSRVLLGAMGGTPSATVEAQLPDGKTLWSDGAKFRRGNGAIGLGRDVQCGLAGGLADALRDAARKARDAKK